MSVYGRTHETGVPDAVKVDNSLPAHLQGGDDDDWDTDPDYVNDVSEKDQRWGSKEIVKPDVQSHGGIEAVREKAFNQDAQAGDKEYAEKKSLYGSGQAEVKLE